MIANPEINSNPPHLDGLERGGYSSGDVENA
jgi:hypothetical protein